jgi:hypothetical protein
MGYGAATAEASPAAQTANDSKTVWLAALTARPLTVRPSGMHGSEAQLG